MYSPSLNQSDLPSLLPSLPASSRRFPTTLHLYHRSRLFGRRTLYLGAQQGEPSHTVTHHRFHRPRVSIRDCTDKNRKLATVERMTFQQARVWTSIAMPHCAGHPSIITCRHPPTCIWGFTVSDVSARLGVRYYTDIYEWRPTRLAGEVPRQLGIVIGWALLRKERLEYQHLIQSPVRVVQRKEEVVALAGKAPQPRRSNPKAETHPLVLESERLFTLRFVGKGCETGELGECWEVYAVITWLGLWHRI